MLPSVRFKGLLPWSQLDGLLYCRGCGTWFRMSNVGRLVAVPSPESQIKMAASAAQSTWREDPTEPARSVNDNRHPKEGFWPAGALAWPWRSIP